MAVHPFLSLLFTKKISIFSNKLGVVLKSVIHIEITLGHNNGRTQGGEALMYSTSPDWLYGLLSTHLPQDSIKKVESFIHAESWASPSARNRDLLLQKEELPLRFHLDIDVKV